MSWSLYSDNIKLLNIILIFAQIYTIHDTSGLENHICPEHGKIVIHESGMACETNIS